MRPSVLLNEIQFPPDDNFKILPLLCEPLSRLRTHHFGSRRFEHVFGNSLEPCDKFHWPISLTHQKISRRSWRSCDLRYSLLTRRKSVFRVIRLGMRLDDLNGQVPWERASWGRASWGRASWGLVPWGQARWRLVPWAQASWGLVPWGQASWRLGPWAQASWGLVPHCPVRYRFTCMIQIAFQAYRGKVRQRVCHLYTARYRCTCTIREAHREQIGRWLVPLSCTLSFHLHISGFASSISKTYQLESCSLSRALLKVALGQFGLNLKHIENKSKTLSPRLILYRPLHSHKSSISFASSICRVIWQAKTLFSVYCMLSMLWHSFSFASEKNYRAPQRLCARLFYTLRHLRLRLHFKRLNKRQAETITRPSRARPVSKEKASRSSHFYLVFTIFLRTCPLTKFFISW